MDDIIFSVAWSCGERSCKVGWHKASYWSYDDGYSVDNYSDGDHEDIDEADLPKSEEIEASWREYAKHVATTGEDPLGEYYVKRSIKVRETWRFKFNNSIVGAVLIEAKHGKSSYRHNELPGHIATYLNLSTRGKLNDFATWADFAVALPGVKPMKWITIHIDHDKPREATVVENELKRLARRKAA